MTRSSWFHRDATSGSPLGAWFERRAARAESLERELAGSRDVLAFAAGLYRVQAPLAEQLARSELSGELQRDVALEALEPLLRYAGAQGPPGLRAAVDHFRSDGQRQLQGWWSQSRSGRVDYLARLLLRPYGEALAARQLRAEPMALPASAAASSSGRAHACPGCGGLAWIGWRKSGSGDEAPARYLGCGLCGREQALSRIACAACDEAAPDKLAVYQSERFPHVRLEACDRCQRYGKSIDLSLDGRAIPEVDDLASLAMDLWAQEQGYERLEPSLAGL